MTDLYTIVQNLIEGIPRLLDVYSIMPGAACTWDFYLCQSAPHWIAPVVEGITMGTAWLGFTSWVATRRRHLPREKYEFPDHN